MRGILVRWAILAVGIAVAARLFDGVEVTGGFWGYVWVAALLGLVNVLVRPILILLTLPLTILTLGAFLLVVNALTLALVDWLSDTIEIDRFLTTLFAAGVITIVSWLLSSVFGDD